MKQVLSLTLDELKGEFEEKGYKPFRASQLYTALLQGKTKEEITTLPKDFLDKLEMEYELNSLKLITKKVSSDGTVKFAFGLKDNNIIEAVLMKYKYGYTLCISTQVGCRMGCCFCASGMHGLVRDLTCGEILSEVVFANKYLGGTVKERKITNLVLMGCGEPLDNYDNVTKFINILTKEFNFSQRNISLSTCGLVKNIYRLADEGYKLTLTISLHAPTDEIRKKIMKVAHSYTIDEVVKAADYYNEKAGRRIVFEYTLIDGINSSFDCCDKLVERFKNKCVHINVINLNKVEEKEYSGVNKKQAYAFVDRLNKNGVSATLRRTLGEDIDGACGQLRQKLMK